MGIKSVLIRIYRIKLLDKMYLYVITIFVGGLLYAFDMHTIVKNTIVDKYTKFRAVNRLTELKYKTTWAIICVSIQLIVKMYWLNFLQWLNTSVEHRDKNTLILSYVYNGRLYKTVVKPRRGPKHVLLITDDNNEEVGDLITPYLGPREDWHKQELTPQFWKMTGLTFHTDSGETVSFTENEQLTPFE